MIIIEVTTRFFEPGDKTSCEELEDYHWLGDSWEDHFENLAEDPDADNPDVLTPLYPANVINISPCVGFLFTSVENTIADDHSSPMERLLSEDGPDELFSHCRKQFLMWIEEDRVADKARSKKVTLGEFVLDPRCGYPAKLFRLLTAWELWVDRTYDNWNGGYEYDYGVDLLGRVIGLQVQPPEVTKESKK